MVYVKHFDILGVDTAQIPCIELYGVPNAATVGAVGLLGMDVTSEGREVYICTAVNGAIYTWQPLKDGKDGSCVVKAGVDINGDLIITLSDGKVINAGPVKGEPGKDGATGRNGEDGVSVTGTEINERGELVVSFSNGETTNVGKVVGENGVSIIKAEWTSSNELLITLSNDTVINLGVVNFTIQALLGTEPIGEYGTIYYNGTTFVERPYSLEEMSWEQIAELSESGRAAEYMNIGDEKTVELTTGEKVTFVVLDFNHDDLADSSGKAGITFGMKDLLTTRYPIHDVDGAVAYQDSTMHTSTLPTIRSTLPSELRSKIKSVSKQGKTLADESVQFDTELFLFSISELSSTSNDGLGSRYEYYGGASVSENELRQKKLGGAGDPIDWWIRDAHTFKSGSITNGWHRVLTTGSINVITRVNNTGGVCFGFCI